MIMLTRGPDNLLAATELYTSLSENRIGISSKGCEMSEIHTAYSYFINCNFQMKLKSDKTVTNYVYNIIGIKSIFFRI